MTTFIQLTRQDGEGPIHVNIDRIDTIEPTGQRAHPGSTICLAGGGTIFVEEPYEEVVRRASTPRG